MKLNVRVMPRRPHKHCFGTIARLKGNRVRYGCNDCPAIDPWWHRLTEPLHDLTTLQATALPRVQAEVDRRTRQKAAGSLNTTGWVSGSGGRENDPQTPRGSFFVLDPGRTVGVVQKAITPIADDGYLERSRSDNDFGIQRTEEEPVYPDPDHPHANLPAEPEFTVEALNKLKKRWLQTIAVTMGVKHSTKTTNAELIAGITVAQELPTLLGRMTVRELKTIAKGMGFDKPYTHDMFVQVLLDNKRDELIKMFVQEALNGKE